jgi:hypothetical protein
VEEKFSEKGTVFRPPPYGERAIVDTTPDGPPPLESRPAFLLLPASGPF